MIMEKTNIKETVPFFAISNMEESLRFYVDGLGFEMTHSWIPKDKIEWCRLQRDAGALMLQEFHEQLEDKLGNGVSIVFICNDALAIYHEIKDKGIVVSEPFVGNNMWVISIKDPDGYSIDFESMTDVPEETKFSEWFK
jgi:catechol 2,3-dioxygenase-like lactoylglutathione lyase family enzyme